MSGFPLSMHERFRLPDRGVEDDAIISSSESEEENRENKRPRARAKLTYLSPGSGGARASPGRSVLKKTWIPSSAPKVRSPVRMNPVGFHTRGAFSEPSGVEDVDAIVDNDFGMKLKKEKKKEKEKEKEKQVETDLWQEHLRSRASTSSRSMEECGPSMNEGVGGSGSEGKKQKRADLWRDNLRSHATARPARCSVMGPSGGMDNVSSSHSWSEAAPPPLFPAAATTTTRPNSSRHEGDAGSSFSLDATMAVPASIARHLRPYQKDGVKFLHSRFMANEGAILGDDMGLGKTLQAIAFISALLASDAKSKILIVCPGSVMAQWGLELDKWGSFRYSLAESNAILPALGRVRAGQTSILIMSYDCLRINISFISGVSWTCAIFDEIHRIKNRNAKVSHVLLFFYIVMIKKVIYI